MPESVLFPRSLPSNQRLRGKRPSELEVRTKSPDIKATQVQPAPAPSEGGQRATSLSVRRSRKSEHGRQKSSCWSLGSEFVFKIPDDQNASVCQTCPPPPGASVSALRGGQGVIYTLCPGTRLCPDACAVPFTSSDPGPCRPPSLPTPCQLRPEGTPPQTSIHHPSPCKVH